MRHLRFPRPVPGGVYGETAPGSLARTVSTRGLIAAALLLGLAILVAFALQVTIAR
jgi:hypothetical protein